MLKDFQPYLEKPALYAPSSSDFWDNEHISKQMLAAHLHPELDAATRSHPFLDRSAAWIASLAPPAQHPALLDLGCGPGLYAERFCRAGYRVTGIDFSARSINYAKAQAEQNGSAIEYLYQDYMSIDYAECFDAVTLIYCDYAVFSATDRQRLLKKIHRALRLGGKFVFDVFTPRMRAQESRSWEFFASGGFFSESPHLCINAVYQYIDEDKTELRQSIVVTESAVDCYNIWDHFFTREKLLFELSLAGFPNIEFFGDVADAPFSESGETICVVATKT